MKRAILSIILFINSVAFVSAMSADATATDTKLNDILIALERNDNATENVKFSYKQEIQYVLTKETQHNSGEMIFDKPNNFYFKQFNPLEQNIISNGKKVWVYTPSYKQVVVGDWKSWLNSGFIPNSSISMSLNWGELKKHYSFYYMGEEENCYVIQLTPLKGVNAPPSSVLSDWKMKLWVNVQDYKLTRADLIGENVNVVTKISDYITNSKINKNIFNFKTPSGVEIMKMQ
jgi:outer membrane lipoprotein carrier protein